MGQGHCLQSDPPVMHNFTKEYKFVKVRNVNMFYKMTGIQHVEISFTICPILFRKGTHSIGVVTLREEGQF